MRPLVQLLDELTERTEQGLGTAVVSELCDDLRTRRNHHGWSNVVAACREHRLQALLLQDPYTSRAFWKPRGYAGDAEMLDYIYMRTPPTDTTELGRALFQATTVSPNACSVVARRNLLAQKIDEISATRPHARVLSLACGHLREAQLSAAVTEKRLGELVAVDQDALSLEVVRQETLAATTVHASVNRIIRREIAFADFDLVYAAGLFGYLTDSVGSQLRPAHLSVILDHGGYTRW